MSLGISKRAIPRPAKCNGAGTPSRSTGEPGSETWPNEDAMAHGGGMTWMPGTYDPELNLIYWGTGNPNPVHAGQGRKGDNLWTCSIVALQSRYRQDGLVVPGFAARHARLGRRGRRRSCSTAEFDGQPRKLLAQASRNGYFFVLDRTNGKNSGQRPLHRCQLVKGRGLARPADSEPGQGAQDRWRACDSGIRRRDELAAAELRSRNRTFLRQRHRRLTASTISPIPTSNRKATVGAMPACGRESALKAIDYQTGKIRWTHAFRGKRRRTLRHFDHSR